MIALPIFCSTRSCFGHVLQTSSPTRCKVILSGAQSVQRTISMDRKSLEREWSNGRQNKKPGQRHEALEETTGACQSLVPSARYYLPCGRLPISQSFQPLQCTSQFIGAFVSKPTRCSSYVSRKVGLHFHTLETYTEMNPRGRGGRPNIDTYTIFIHFSPTTSSRWIKRYSMDITSSKSNLCITYYRTRNRSQIRARLPKLCSESFTVTWCIITTYKHEIRVSNNSAKGQ